MKKSVNKLFEASFKKNWNLPALSNYQQSTVSYAEMCATIARLHILFDSCGLQKGDKVTICGRNHSNWCISFLAAMTYGAVPVPLLHEFKPVNIHHLTNHSDAKILFVGESIKNNLDFTEMPALEAVIQINDFSILYAKRDIYYSVKEHIDDLFKNKYPSFGPKDLNYYEDKPEDLALINYTSGTSGFSKGVMLPYRSVYSNMMFAEEVIPQVTVGSTVVAMLPTAHMYGMMFEFLYEMYRGSHLYFLTRLPSPKVIMGAMADLKPAIIISVPMVIEKIYKSLLAPFINKDRTKLFLSMPGIDQMVLKKVCQSLTDAFGGNFQEVIIGGAAFNREVEAFFKRMNFKYTVGYGMTECGPIITYAPWNKTKLYSCGKAAPRMEFKIDSKDPKNIPGEILVKGDNVFLGYYKNAEATKAAFTDRGWFRTGDMGTQDADGFLYLKGRCKSMILGPSGQNIYPEEIESSINNLPFVIESLVIEDNGALTALIYPDFEHMREEGLTEEQLLAKLKEGVQIANLEQPNYCKVTKVEIYPEEFAKTPKRSIKRYLYQRSNQ
jgi:Long-chain acyl-CoA synthetases (AMP-forming)